MNDKYFLVNTITADGSPIPKCKGILVNNLGTTGGITFHFRNYTGGTMSAYLGFPQGNNILSIQPYAIPTSGIGTGLTAFYIN